MNRYGFNIRTRSGQRVDHIVIMAATQDDAERRLLQMYVQCEILECRQQSVVQRRVPDTLDMENVIGLIAQGPPSVQHPGTH